MDMVIKIALDAGHGLKTAGKQTPDGIKEWTLNDKVRDKIVTMLKGYDVEFVFPDNNEGNTDEGLTKRKTMYLTEKVDVAVSIHHNAYQSKWGTHTGVGVYTDKNATAQDRKLAECICEKLAKNTGLRNRGIKKANFTVIYQDTIPAVLVEGGFMDSTIDYPVITSDKGQTAYAKAVADGLIEFLGLKKVETSEAKTTKPEDVPMKQIKKGEKGQIVRVWQSILGFTGDDIDGSFGAKTKAATIEFQKKAFPKDEDEWDGIVGPKTWKAGLESVN